MLYIKLILGSLISSNSFKLEAIIFCSLYNTMYLKGLNQIFRMPYLLLLGANCNVSHNLWSHMLVQRYKSDCIKGKGNHKLEASSTLFLLLLWNSSRCCWRTSWSWRWFYFRTTVSRIGSSSSGSHLIILMHYLLIRWLAF